MALSPLEQIKTELNTARSILISTRSDASIGTLAAAIALSEILKSNEKQIQILTCAQVPGNIDLPGKERIIKNPPQTGGVLKINLNKSPVSALRYEKREQELLIFLDSDHAFDPSSLKIEAGQSDIDLIITLDTPDLNSLGNIYSQQTSLFYSKPIINLDHNEANERYGHINFIDVTACSSAELVMQLADYLKIERSAKINRLLLTAIIADTDSFQLQNTTPKAMNTAAQLIDSGVDQQQIIRTLYKTRDLSFLKLLGRVLARIQNDTQLRTTWSLIQESDLKNSGSQKDMLPAILDEIIRVAPQADIYFLLTSLGPDVQGIIATPKILKAFELANQFNKAEGTNVLASFVLPYCSLHDAEKKMLAVIG